MDAKEDVSCRHGREQQVAVGHRGRKPKCDEKSRHQRMVYPAVNRPFNRWRVMIFTLAQMKVHLAQAEQIEMVDHKR